MRWILVTVLATISPDLTHYLIVLAAVAGLLFLIGIPPEERAHLPSSMRGAQGRP